MASILTVLITICTVLLKPSIANGNEGLQCYFCEYQMTNACGDSSDITALTSVPCKDLNYTAPIKGGDRRAVAHEVLSRVVDGKFRGAPLIRDVFQKGSVERTEKPFKYVCLKISLTAEDKRGTIRSCIRQEATIEDACDFIKQELGSDFQVNNCYSCESDNCNSGSLLKISSFIILCGLYFCFFKTNYFM
ncbi:hypothetical protein ILUMI_00601 [Ignelater luminosus]|uniref:Protein quiver n=1 Tax=Ignelater luminosus TaxID=2038154 RepID=A0A8K0DG52_IGNLU|nr:hypothetical protein ILUMI_00601 [Ignelater luminosus]